MTTGHAEPAEDSRAWVGRVRPGAEAEHEQFVAWLRSADGRELFRRRRLTEYQLSQEGNHLVVMFRAPHTGDPRIMIDFLRYPGAWPEFWEFERAGRGDEMPLSKVRVHWRRDAGVAPAEA